MIFKYNVFVQVDPYIKRIETSCSNVALYNFNSERSEWEKTQVDRNIRVGENSGRVLVILCRLSVILGRFLVILGRLSVILGRF